MRKERLNDMLLLIGCDNIRVAYGLIVPNIYKDGSISFFFNY
jgi:hypothetical protein